MTKRTERAMPAFKKNDHVALLTSWDNKGTVQVRRAVVHSWGRKIARMQDPATSEMFKFEVSTTRFGAYQNVVADCSDAELETAALEAGAAIVEAERTRMIHCIDVWGDTSGPVYKAAIRKGLDELHEPRVRWHTGI